jgi:peptide/nickel transport system permease protein
LLLTGPVLVAAALIVFVAMRLIPGDPVEVMMGERATTAEISRVRARLGLDLPWPVQFLRFLRRAAVGDFGRSLRTQEPVLSEIGHALPVTVELSILSIALAAMVGVTVGVIAASRRHSWFDNITMVGVLVGISMPVFWTGLLLIMVGAVFVGWFPVSGLLDEGIRLQRVTGLYLLDSILTRNVAGFRSALGHYVLPTITLASIPVAIIARMSRSAMLEEVRKEYVTTARSKGLGERAVTFKHALRNALLPVVTVVGLQFGGLLSGAVLTETIFALPGLGRLAVVSIFSRDYPVIQGVAVVAATLFVAINLLVDLLYLVLDPRIRAV